MKLDLRKLTDMAVRAVPVTWSSADVREGICRLGECRMPIPDLFYDAGEVLGAIFFPASYEHTFFYRLSGILHEVYWRWFFYSRQIPFPQFSRLLYGGDGKLRNPEAIVYINKWLQEQEWPD